MPDGRPPAVVRTGAATVNALHRSAPPLRSGTAHVWLHEAPRPPATIAVARRRRLRLLSAIASCYLGRAVGVAEFGRGAHGRPVLRSGGQHDFNLSQSGRLTAIAVTIAGRIGIDVERVRAISGCLALAAEAFGPATVRELALLREPARSIRFLHYWTRLEALVKAAGAVRTRTCTAATPG